MDVIVLRALDSLHNTVGTELTSNGELRLNGAILVFDKSRSGLSSCSPVFCDMVKFLPFHVMYLMGIDQLRSARLNMQ